MYGGGFRLGTPGGYPKRFESPKRQRETGRAPSLALRVFNRWLRGGESTEYPGHLSFNHYQQVLRINALAGFNE